MHSSLCDSELLMAGMHALTVHLSGLLHTVFHAHHTPDTYTDST
jgi:hypothetical protein